MRLLRYCGFLVVGACVAFSSHGNADTREVLRWIRPSGIDGALVLCGGGKIPEAAQRRFLELAGGEKARAVLIPAPSATADADAAATQIPPWLSEKAESVTVLQARSREQADDPKFVEPLKNATAAWLAGGEPSRLAELYVGTAFEKELHALLKRGGVIGGASAGTALLAHRRITGSDPEVHSAIGFDLLPDTVIDPYFKRNGQPRSLRHRGQVGIGIDEGTALIVKGRELRVVGESTVSICFAASQTRPERTIELKNGALHDLTALRRAARERTLPAFPAKEPRVPEVPHGSLVIVGGGRLPDEVIKKFIELAGGPDALIVVLPTANPDPLPAGLGEGNFLVRAGAKNVRALPARERADVEAPANLDLLKQARGIWFGGGRQWRFVDAYAGTKAEPLFHDLLKRGGVIGGSSAGASIQAEYMVRGSPLGNAEMMSEGYERGLGFLPGAAVDQHFTQRNRFKDLAGVVKTFPQLLGIGIDEGTALIVRGHVGEVMGPGKVHFYDAKKQANNGDTEPEAVGAGGKYDLKARALSPTR